MNNDSNRGLMVIYRLYRRYDLAFSSQAVTIFSGNLMTP